MPKSTSTSTVARTTAKPWLCGCSSRLIRAKRRFDDLAACIDESGLAHFATQNQVNVRLTARELWHVTLAFLGDVPAERVEDVAAAIGVLPGAPASLRVGGGGKFGRGRFTILWAGLRGDVDRLDAIAKSVRSRLKKARVHYDPKPFRPHLTIARPGDRAPVAITAADIVRLNAYDGPEWTCDEACLVSSDQGPKPKHEVIARFEIAPPG